MGFKKIITATIITTLMIITQTACVSEEPVSKTEFLLDTVCTITVYGMSEDQGTEVLNKAFTSCAAYEKMLSKTDKGSDIYNINHARGKPVTVTKKTYGLIKDALEYGRISKGKFDITIGAVSQLWDFKSDNPKVPDRDKLEAAVKTVDYRNVVLMEGNRVRLKNPDAKLDLGGVAKGYIADRLTEEMESEGVEQAIINLGGNIVVLGEKAKGMPWNIGIERPYSDRSEIIGTVALMDSSIVTSGIYERKFSVNGKLYHHVLDPDTGYPAETRLEAVSIQAPKGFSEQCDAYSTICLILGLEEGTDLVEKTQSIKAAFINKEDHIKTTKGMEIIPVD